MTDRHGLTWQQTFFKRVVSLSTARWFFSLLNEKWWRERSADGVVTDLRVMQVRGHRVSGLLLKEDFSDLWVVEIRRSWAHDLWEVDYWTKGQTPHWAKCTGDLAPKTSTWKRKRWKSRFRKKKWKIEKDAEESKVRIEERTDNHSSAWHMDGMTRTNTWANVVSHITRARCEREKGDVWGVLFVRSHARIFSSFSHSVSTAALAAGIFMAWSKGINLCTKL